MRGGGCGDSYHLAEQWAMHWFGKQKQLHAGGRWGRGGGGPNYYGRLLLLGSGNG